MQTVPCRCKAATLSTLSSGSSSARTSAIPTLPARYSAADERHEPAGKKIVDFFEHKSASIDKSFAPIYNYIEHFVRL